MIILKCLIMAIGFTIGWIVGIFLAQAAVSLVEKIVNYFDHRA